MLAFLYVSGLFFLVSIISKIDGVFAKCRSALLSLLLSKTSELYKAII